MIVCMFVILFLIRLPDVQACDLAGRGELEPEIGSKVAPLLRMECVGQTEAVVFHAVDRSEPFVAESGPRERLEASRGAVVVELGIGFEERRPGFPVAALKRFDGRFEGGVRQRIRDH
jgi:hypothetical protein